MDTETESGNPLLDAIKAGRKYGSTTYSYSARTIKSNDSDDGKVVVTVRNNRTGKLVMEERLNLKDFKENGLPLPRIDEINAKE